jgi:hypothetical protein
MLSKAFLRNRFPCPLPYSTIDPTLKVEHAFLEVESLIKCIIVLIYTTPKLHNHLYWFWDPTSSNYKYNFFEIATFFDGFPLFGGAESATILCMKILNLPALAQRPEFIFTLLMALCKETSGVTAKLLRYCSEKLKKVLTNGIEITLSGFPDDMTVPKSPLRLNGNHLIKFGDKVMFGSDGKASLYTNGCNSANQRFIPFIDIHKECWVNPDHPITDKSYVPLKMRSEMFNRVQKFRDQQRLEFIKEAKAIKANQKYSKEDKPRKINAAWKRLVKDAVLEYAASLRTGSVHLQPFEIAEICAPCGLHVDTNEVLRVLQFIVDRCAEVTLTHGYAPGFMKKIGAGNKGTCDTTYPDITKALPHGPLVKLLYLLDKIKVARVAQYFRKQYTPPLEQHADLEGFVVGDIDITCHLDEIFCGESNEAEESDVKQQRAKRIRLIGEHVEKICLNFPAICECLSRHSITANLSGKMANSKHFKSCSIEWLLGLMCIC